MNKRLIAGAIIALTLIFTLGFVAFSSALKASAAAPKASGRACGTFTTSINKSNVIVAGVVVGYGETLTDGCGNYEQHGHLSATPIGGHAGPYSLLLETEQGDVAVSPNVYAAPADVYLSESAVVADHPFFEISLPGTPIVYYTGVNS